jgi:hypothetical protein
MSTIYGAASFAFNIQPLAVLSLWSKYFQHTPVLKQPQFMSFTWGQRLHLKKYKKYAE